jgi:hypothetical protein
MRLASALLIVPLVLLFSGLALADKYDPFEKDWHYGPIVTNSVMPEVEPNDTCPGQGMACGDVIDPAAITAGDLDWYFFEIASAGTVLTIGTDAPTGGGSCDTYLELYDSCTGSMLAYDDDSGPGAYSLISNYATTHAGTFYVKCRGYGSTTTGGYKLFVNCNAPTPPPVNDQCSGAIAIDRCTTGNLAGDLTYANNNYDPGSGGCSTGYPEAGRDVAYVMNLVAGDIVALTYTGNAYDASMYIVTDCANVAGSCVIGTDAGYNVETINWTVPTSGAYYLILDAYGTNAGTTFTLAWTITCPPPPVPHVCCVGEACLIVFAEECAEMGGIWHPEWDSCGPPNPCATPHVCCLGETCLLVIEEECLVMGGVWHPELSSCGPPNPCGLAHVCCVGEQCLLVIAEECAELGGVWHPELNSCGPPNPCGMAHVCCLGEECALVIAEECAEMGGVFHPEWSSCGPPNPCGLPHVCCVGEGCFVILLEECDEMVGVFHPEWDTCGPPNPCQLTPVLPDTWGGVKNLYR